MPFAPIPKNNSGGAATVNVFDPTSIGSFPYTAFTHTITAADLSGNCLAVFCAESDNGYGLAEYNQNGAQPQVGDVVTCVIKSDKKFYWYINGTTLMGGFKNPFPFPLESDSSAFWLVGIAPQSNFF